MGFGVETLVIRLCEGFIPEASTGMPMPLSGCTFRIQLFDFLGEVIWAIEI